MFTLFKISLTLAIFVNIRVSTVHSSDPIQKPENKTINETSMPQFNFKFDDEESFRSNYALDPSETKRLALTEEHLASVLSDILANTSIPDQNNPCYTHLRKYLNQFNQDTKAVNGKRGIRRANDVTENPNLVLRMIRRIVVTLLNYTVTSCKNLDPDIETTINETFTGLYLAQPRQLDLDDALSGLLRIHYVYGFNATSEMRLGIFNGVNTKAILDFDDCLALGTTATRLGAESLAYQWLISASVELADTQTDREKSEREKNLENAWLDLMKLEDVDNLTALHQLPHKQEYWFGHFFEFDFYATCRGELEQTLAYQSRLRCFYQFNWDPYFYINPVKTQVLSGHPLIYQFYDVVGDETVDYIRKSLRRNMTRSAVVSKKKSEAEFTPVRTSMNAWYQDQTSKKMEYGQSKIDKLSRTIEKLTGLEVMKERASTLLQVVKYGSLGGHYDFHLDSLQNSTFNFEKEGDRLATFLMFFADVKMGGYTAFPLAGTFAKPEKGSAILWYNTMLNGNADTRTRHGGCPVILGSKEVGNRWIFQYENMFNEPCSLNPNE